MERLKFLLGIIMMSYAAQLESNAIIFDLNGVLLDKNSLKVAYYLHAGDLLSYAISSSSRHLDLEKRCKEFLGFLAEKEQPDQTKRKVLLPGEQALPGIMQGWLKGERTTKELIDGMSAFIHEHTGFFVSPTEKKLIHAITSLVDPTVFSSVMAPVPAMMKVVQECKRQTDQQGNPKHQLFILSNWDKESFDLIKKQFASLFEHFDEKNIIISGQIGMMKPDREIFEYIIKKYNLDPTKCILIDDQPENIAGAISHGIAGIHHKKPAETRKALISHGVIIK